ncbi:hypothetical protein Nepgr_008422 [Nepenthes gracilis]|uniref:Nitrate regulatory gene2 protein-like n=1 Tax=Nepenthes gracilis TaxID=150966 RepID=A0AAD3XJ77_NEPGR|nr:hypothetical protein Nepgr_008422 [Nepenthes gracilis]
MGCGLSKIDGAEDVVSLCRERKRLMKMAVEQRQAFADAHSKYIHSLYSVSSAIRVFVTRYSSSSSPSLVNLPSPTGKTLDSRKTLEANNAFQSCNSTISSDSSGVDREREDEAAEENEGVCEFFYGDKPPPMTEREIGWDFFNLFDSSSIQAVELRKESKGIPELGDDKEERKGVMLMKNGDLVNDKSGIEKVGKVEGRRTSDKETKGRDLLEALKDVEDHFMRAYESGLEVSRMLELNRVHKQSGLVEIEENSSNAMQSIAWNHLIPTQTSPCKSLHSYSSKTSSTWTESRSDFFDDCGGMVSGSHSFTLGRLYAWEKKLFEEVKGGDINRKSYQQKCSQLGKQGIHTPGYSKARDELTSLHNRILVSKRSAESISRQIEKLRDEELQPQLAELLHGLMRGWKTMLESHEMQANTMLEVKSFMSPVYGEFGNDSHRLATLQLEAALQSWHSSFIEYIATEKAYIKSLHGWLSKLMDTETKFYMKERPSTPPLQMGTQTLLVTCQKWIDSLEMLPDKAVKHAMKSFAKDVRSLWIQQGVEQQQKRKVDGLAKEIDRRHLALQKEGNEIIIMKKISKKIVRNQVEYSSERKDLMDQLRKRLDLEKVKHCRRMEESHKMALNGFRVEFSSVFESLVDFSRASVKLYASLVTYCENVNKGSE